MDEITQRNFKAMSDGLKNQREDTSNMNIRINKLESIVLDQQNKIVELTAKVMQLQIKNMGNGPTNR